MSSTTPLKEIDVLVIKTLLKHEYILPINTISIDEMVELMNNCSNEQNVKIAKPTMYKIASKLLELGYLKEGLKVNRTRKFYVSPDGALVCSEYCRTSDEDKKKLIEAYQKLQMPDEETSWNFMLYELKFKAGAWKYIPEDALEKLKKKFPTVKEAKEK